ncbi:hypothetical protein QGM71_11435 [Virgibacillus sp. C22-A2]|uniref:Uncharacterized protein n=1 Tax=Virgibacillus tibetensis TaxID=3042313 RepID=A0ABU6KGW0_9BACI|nr:hypothetical protein [Virgibacillus sp. C22-A2]
MKFEKKHIFKFLIVIAAAFIARILIALFSTSYNQYAGLIIIVISIAVLLFWIYADEKREVKR